MRIRHLVRTAAAVALPLVLAACVNPQKNLDPEFGQSVRQDLTAQIADPDARYARQDPPAASGARSALAQQRYNKGTPTPVASQGTTNIRSQSGSPGN